MFIKIKNIISSIIITISILLIIVLLPIIGVVLFALFTGMLIFLILEDEKKCKDRNKSNIYTIHSNTEDKD